MLNLCTCEKKTVELGNDTFKNCCICLLFEFVFYLIVNVDLLVKPNWPQQDKKFSGFQILKDKRNYESKKKKKKKKGNGWEGRFKKSLK